MNYILQPLFEPELASRKDYLLHTFHFYFIEVQRTANFIELRSFPFRNDDIVILYGHYPWILDYFAEHRLELERKIKIINSCYPAIVVPLLKQKQIYYSKVNERGEACCYDSGAFGLSFDVTDSELDALNSAHLPLMEQIGFAYERVA